MLRQIRLEQFSNTRCTADVADNLKVSLPKTKIIW
jgi:hypothetical protein